MTYFRPDKLKKYNCAGTIADFAVSILCNLDKPVMSYQNAASWGYFDCTDNNWNLDLLKNEDFPTDLLPEIRAPGDFAGVLTENWHSIPKGTAIGKL